MAAIYSHRLADGNEGGAGSGLAYTAPALTTVVMRSLTVVCFPGTTFGGIYRTASVAYVAGHVALSGGLEVAVLDFRHILNAGETVTWQFQGGGGTWMLSGYLLT